MIDLMKTGKEIGGMAFGKCPFCGSKLFVSDTEQFCCFNCFKQGNAVDYIAYKQRVSYAVADKMVNGEKDTAEILDVLAEVDTYFQSRLKLNNAYLKKRGISAKTARLYHIGYADGSLTELFDPILLQKAGLLTSFGNDIFRGRLMFPIMNPKGQVVGFGGRRITDNSASPKYINSPETEVFHKAECLYGVDKLNSKKPVYIVEGYMDALTMQTHGINAVAVLGTAVGKKHAQLLRSLGVKEIVLSLDGDEAGQKNTLKAIKALSDFNIRVLTGYGDAKDPDEFLKTHDKKDFEALKTITPQTFLVKRGFSPVDVL